MMTAQELVEILLEDAPTERSRLVMFHPSKISDKGQYVTGDEEAGAVVKAIRGVYNIKAAGEEAMNALDHMIGNGYSLVVRNRKGQVTVYTRNRALKIPGRTIRQMADYLGIKSNDDKVRYTNEVRLDDSGYQTMRFGDLLVSSTPDQDEANARRKETGQTVPDGMEKGDHTTRMQSFFRNLSGSAGVYEPE